MSPLELIAKNNVRVDLHPSEIQLLYTLLSHDDFITAIKLSVHYSFLQYNQKWVGLADDRARIWVDAYYLILFLKTDRVGEFISHIPPTRFHNASKWAIGNFPITMKSVPAPTFKRPLGIRRPVGDYWNPITGPAPGETFYETSLLDRYFRQRSIQVLPSGLDKSMLRVVAISDTHGLHDIVKVPYGDLLICAGDVTNKGTALELASFVKWFVAQPHQYKIMIAGNHDCGLAPTQFPWEADVSENDRDIIRSFLAGHYPNTHYLHNSAVNIRGYNFFGIPFTKHEVLEHDFWVNCNKDQCCTHINQIPPGIDVLITHGPPKGILDVEPAFKQRVGCPHIKRHVYYSDSIIVHIFGHIHGANGEEFGTKENGQVCRYINASLCDNTNNITGEARVFDLPGRY